MCVLDTANISESRPWQTPNVCLNKSRLIVPCCKLGFRISTLTGNSVEADSVLCKCHKKESDPPCAFKTTTVESRVLAWHYIIPSLPILKWFWIPAKMDLGIT